jgi:hypothetical protein
VRAGRCSDGSANTPPSVAPLGWTSANIYAMPWRARCYECGQAVPITQPVFATQSLFLEGDLGHATASYEAHPRRPSDVRSCSGVSKTVPQYQMREAYSTTPGEDPPRLDPRGIRRRGRGPKEQ